MASIYLLIGLIFLSAFFSGIETALMSVNNVKINALLKQGKKGAEALHRIKQNPHKMIITILIGNNIVNIGAASLATVIFTDMFGSSGVGIATGIMTFLILVFGEITPKTFAANNSEKVSLKVARPIEILSIILTPIIVIFEYISKLMTKLLGGSESNKLSESELRTIVSMGKQEGLLSKEAANMMHNVLEFEGTNVTQIMTPDVNIDMIKSDKKLKEIIDFIIRSKYSKFPIYRKNRDDIIGILDVDDVLKELKHSRLNKKVDSLARPVFFVPESKRIDELLNEFEKNKMPIAIVVDEYGEVSGLVTIEDILEEIVGDIFDKSTRSSVFMKKLTPSMSRVDAKISVQEINKELNLGIKEEKFNTLAGYITKKLGRIPKRGEKIALKHVTIEIDQVTKQKIKSVKIIKD